MPHFHVHVKAIHEDTNPDTKQRRFRAEVVEVKPRTFMVNMKDNTDFINQMTSLVGKNIMMPAKETTMNGQLYLAMDAGGDIIPMPDSQPVRTESKPTPSATSQPANTQQPKAGA